MSEPFVAEIRIFPYNFAPRGWASCSGQLLPIAQNTALFSLLGTTFGGDGRTTFGLPNLDGRVPIHEGNGPGLTPRNLGEQGGAPTVTLNATQMPSHNHSANCNTVEANDYGPGNAYWAPEITGNMVYAPSTNGSMAAGALLNTGGSQAHNNLQPYLALQFCIALVGLYPSRS